MNRFGSRRAGSEGGGRAQRYGLFDGMPERRYIAATATLIQQHI